MKVAWFNKEFIQSIKEGFKTSTRRLIKGLSDDEYPVVIPLNNGSFMSYIARDGEPTAFVEDKELRNFVRILIPKYFIGEELLIGYKENGRVFVYDVHIKITNMRIEKLRDIEKHWTDCLGEGVEIDTNTKNFFITDNCGGRKYFNKATEAFAYIIEGIYGEGTWNKNPYVWVYDFELV